ncbi:hypothetical protein ykris0001_30820 [Yersinia kristensenii ATCC 33638]|nr:hypothetical protein ykris0001_30820 [Yersinia kristensenii ATCC 33638]
MKDTAGRQIIAANITVADILIAKNGAILPIYYSYLYYVNYATAFFDLYAQIISQRFFSKLCFV